MEKKNVYEDSFAQIRRFNEHNVSICYWNNNVSISDFERCDDGLLIYEHEGEYRGLKAILRIEVDEKKPRRIFSRRGERGPLRFRGTLDHMGIRIHMRRNAFPAKQSGEINGVRFTVELSGRDDLLSFIDEKALRAGRNHRKREAVDKKSTGKNDQPGIV